MYEANIRKMQELLENNPEKADELIVEMDPFGYVAASALERLADGKDPATLVATLTRIHARLPHSKVVSEEAINTLGYNLFRKHKNEEAIATLQLNTEQYPKSANTWDSLGEVQLNTGDMQGGVASYKKALETDPNYPNAETARKIISEHSGSGQTPQPH